MTDEIRYWSKNGQPLQLMEWSLLYMDHSYRLVAETTYGGQSVRTVWEGIDDGVRVAAMYATGVGSESGGWKNVWEGYYPCTLADAQKMHGQFVAVLREKMEEINGGPDALWLG